MTDGGSSPSDRAERFWSRYEIPFEYDTCIKVRRSGLLRGSAGTGHASDTVVHLHVKEAFSAGRLSRTADSFLCEKDSYVPRDGRKERHVDDGESYVPAVTCETCLKRMERWKDVAVRTDGGEDVVEVAVPSADSSGECYHAPGAPCGSYTTETIETTPTDLLERDLRPCGNCLAHHDLNDHTEWREKLDLLADPANHVQEDVNQRGFSTAALRDDERPDATTHARRNAEQLAMADDEDLVTDGGEDEWPALDEMSVGELREHYNDLLDVIYPGDPTIPETEIPEWDRHIEVWRALESRSDVEIPACPECGTRHWNHEAGEPSTCAECGTPAGPGVAEDVQSATQRVLHGKPIIDGGEDSTLAEHDGGVSDRSVIPVSAGKLLNRLDAAARLVDTATLHLSADGVSFTTSDLSHSVLIHIDIPVPDDLEADVVEPTTYEVELNAFREAVSTIAGRHDTVDLTYSHTDDSLWATMGDEPMHVPELDRDALEWHDPEIPDAPREICVTSVDTGRLVGIVNGVAHNASTGNPLVLVAEDGEFGAGRLIQNGLDNRWTVPETHVREVSGTGRAAYGAEFLRDIVEELPTSWSVDLEFAQDSILYVTVSDEWWYALCPRRIEIDGEEVPV
ncbi:hypothetical protein [Halarchaeum sp. P4]|uniref:hypothetical protein n=1 Tax=Halarchaeum sp. P4 TaxID=3421639 RepID=UPI003EB782B5